MLFSEPKIPQCRRSDNCADSGRCFSALQRAENSSIKHPPPVARVEERSFSALQRAENSSMKSHLASLASVPCFSALQRAENSSIVVFRRRKGLHLVFQCSSASRKFLNAGRRREAGARLPFQCSSASRKFLNRDPRRRRREAQTFQCSSASRKFLNVVARTANERLAGVSVLFSEPKIPQLRSLLPVVRTNNGFSALQRAENSSIGGAGAAGDAD